MTVIKTAWPRDMAEKVITLHTNVLGTAADETLTFYLPDDYTNVLMRVVLYQPTALCINHSHGSHTHSDLGHTHSAKHDANNAGWLATNTYAGFYSTGYLGTGYASLASATVGTGNATVAPTLPTTLTVTLNATTLTFSSGDEQDVTAYTNPGANTLTYYADVAGGKAIIYIHYW